MDPSDPTAARTAWFSWNLMVRNSCLYLYHISVLTETTANKKVQMQWSMILDLYILHIYKEPAACKRWYGLSWTRERFITPQFFLLVQSFFIFIYLRDEHLTWSHIDNYQLLSNCGCCKQYIYNNLIKHNLLCQNV